MTPEQHALLPRPGFGKDAKVLHHLRKAVHAGKPSSGDGGYFLEQGRFCRAADVLPPGALYPDVCGQSSPGGFAGNGRREYPASVRGEGAREDAPARALRLKLQFSRKSIGMGQRDKNLSVINREACLVKHRGM